LGPFFTQVFGGHIDSVEQFARSHSSFYVYDCGGPGKLPIVDWLLREGAMLRDSGLADTPEVLLRRDLYRVSFPAREAARITQHVQRDLHAPFDR